MEQSPFPAIIISAFSSYNKLPPALLWILPKLIQLPFKHAGLPLHLHNNLPKQLPSSSIHCQTIRN